MKHSLFPKRSFGLLTTLCLLAVLFSSCIKDELPNSEADITKCIVIQDSSILLWKADTIMNIGYSSQWNYIRIQVKRGSNVGLRSPEFELKPGATISPASGSEHDFSNGNEVVYTVTSEDRKWSRTYVVSYVDNTSYPKINPVFTFEIYGLNVDNHPANSNKFFQIGERDSTNLIYYWASGNPGFLRARGNAGPYEYPTVPYEDGHTGRCVKLETLSTGSLGGMIGMPKAAGNLFLGTFDVDLAFQMKHKEATRFGTPFARIPKNFSGWYQYKAGDILTDRNGNVMGGKDIFDIYAVFYENTNEHGDPYMLDGTNVRVLPNPRIVAMTTFPLEDRKETNIWTEFNCPFEFFKEVDPARLLRNGYNLAIVCSASVDGADFTGALGSTLYIDDFTITCE